MKGYTVGTLLVTGGGLLVFPLKVLLHIDKITIMSICGAVCVIGFCIQMYSAFKIRYDLEKDLTRKNIEDKVVMQKAAELEKGGDPVGAINLLLGKIKVE